MALVTTSDQAGQKSEEEIGNAPKGNPTREDDGQTVVENKSTDTNIATKDQQP